MSILSDAMRLAFRRINNQFIIPGLLGERFGLQNLNLVAAVNVALFPGLRLAFNRIKKNANSSTMSLLSELEFGKALDERSAKLKSIHIAKASVLQLAKARSYHFFVIVRNPYSRVLSAFLNKFQKDAYKQHYGDFGLEPAGFRHFVAWLGESGLDRDPHWDLQTKMLFLPQGKFDSVLRFEEFPAALIQFLRTRKVVLASHHQEALALTNLQTRTRASSRLAAFYDEKTTEIVRRLYRADFEAFGYDNAGTPT